MPRFLIYRLWFIVSWWKFDLRKSRDQYFHNVDISNSPSYNAVENTEYRLNSEGESLLKYLLPKWKRSMSQSSVGFKIEAKQRRIDRSCDIRPRAIPPTITTVVAALAHIWPCHWCVDAKREGSCSSTAQ